MMANQTYVPSECLYIFPCATRTHKTGTVSKFLTQYNLTHFVGGGKNYNLTDKNDTYMRFSVNGYFVQIDYTSQQGKTWWENFLTAAKPGTNHVLYAYINLASDVVQPSGFSDILDVNKQPKLTSFETTTELDKTQGGTSVFTALKLAFLANDSAANAIQGAKVKLATVTDASTNPITLQWQVYSESITFNNPTQPFNGIKITLSQDLNNKGISAKASQVAIGTGQLVAGAVKEAILDSNAVTKTKIADGAVDFTKMCVDTAESNTSPSNTGSLGVKLVNNGDGDKLKVQLLGLVQTADIANYAVTTEKLQSDVQTTLGNVSKLYVGGKDSGWYPVSVVDNILYIGTQKANN